MRLARTADNSAVLIVLNVKESKDESPTINLPLDSTLIVKGKLYLYLSYYRLHPVKAC
jgi:hypothetical protein